MNANIVPLTDEETREFLLQWGMDWVSAIAGADQAANEPDVKAKPMNRQERRAAGRRNVKESE